MKRPIVVTAIRFFSAAVVLMAFVWSLLDLFDPNRIEPNAVGNLVCGVAVTLSMLALSLVATKRRQFFVIDLPMWILHLVLVASIYADRSFQERGDFGSLFMMVAVAATSAFALLTCVLAIAEFPQSRMRGVILFLGASVSITMYVLRPIADYESGYWILVLLYWFFYSQKASETNRTRRTVTAEF